MLKPRFGRSDPRIVRGPGKDKSNGRLTRDQGTRWRPVSMQTLGYLAATAKIGILQVHQSIGDRFNLKFARAFLDNIDLYNPSKKDMDQIQLFSHLLFV